VLGQRGQQGVAPGALAGAHEPQVPVEPARVEQVGQHELAEGGCGDVGPLLGLDERVVQVRGGDTQPSRSAGDSVLDTLPTCTTRSGARACTAATGARS
jgi:hypothetical protein